MSSRCILPAVLALLALAVLAPHAHGRGPGVKRTLDELAEQGRLAPHAHAAYRAQWRSARRGARQLHGAERAALRAVLGHATGLARRRMLAARLVPVFATVEANRRWFVDRDRSAPLAGTRRSFAGSRVVWQFQAGAGWQIHPLASAGKLNAKARRERARPEVLAAFADDLLALAVRRRGFLALEYLFPYNGRPGWISGMATATTLSALARVWRRTGDDRYRQAGEAMLGAFNRPPPWGVRLERGEGRAHYLLYSQSPGLLVGNGFAQALIGLHEFATVTGSPAAAAVLEPGLLQAQHRMRFYDTGDWSLYWRSPGTRRGTESTLHYHRVFAGFLAELCERFPAHEFCAMHERFQRYEIEPVRIGRLRTRSGERALRVRVWVSKAGTATLRLVRGERTRRSVRLVLRRGTQQVRWRIRRGGGDHRLVLDATSLTGVPSSRERDVTLDLGRSVDGH